MADNFDLKVANKYRSKADNAIQRKLEFTISFQSMKNMMRAKRCYYTGLPLTEPRQGLPLRGSDRTIDRIDSEKGYIPGNVVACSHAANELKAQVERAGLAGIKMGRQIFDRTIKRIEGAKK